MGTYGRPHPDILLLILPCPGPHFQMSGDNASAWDYSEFLLFYRALPYPLPLVSALGYISEREINPFNAPGGLICPRDMVWSTYKMCSLHPHYIMHLWKHSGRIKTQILPKIYTKDVTYLRWKFLGGSCGNNGWWRCGSDDDFQVVLDVD